MRGISVKWQWRLHNRNDNIIISYQNGRLPTDYDDDSQPLGTVLEVEIKDKLILRYQSVENRTIMLRNCSRGENDIGISKCKSSPKDPVDRVF